MSTVPVFPIGHRTLCSNERQVERKGEEKEPTPEEKKRLDKVN